MFGEANGLQEGRSNSLGRGGTKCGLKLEKASSFLKRRSREGVAVCLGRSWLRQDRGI